MTEKTTTSRLPRGALRAARARGLIAQVDLITIRRMGDRAQQQQPIDKLFFKLSGDAQSKLRASAHEGE